MLGSRCWPVCVEIPVGWQGKSWRWPGLDCGVLPHMCVCVCVCVCVAQGYNAMEDKVEDLLKAGVIDPAKVTKNGLLNSCSIAGIMLTTQVRDTLGTRTLTHTHRQADMAYKHPAVLLRLGGLVPCGAYASHRSLTVQTCHLALSAGCELRARFCVERGL